MGLIHTETGKYIKVTDISLQGKYVQVKEYESQDIRENPTEWNKIETKTHYLGAEFDTEFVKDANAEKSSQDDILSKAYAALKGSTYPEPEYMDSL